MKLIDRIAYSLTFLAMAVWNVRLYAVLGHPKLLSIALILLALSMASCGATPVLLENPPPNEGKLEIKEVSLGPMGPSANDIKITSDQKRVAYIVRKGDKEAVVVDGREGPAYDKVRSLHFSPDSERVAYSARRNGLQFIVADGVEGKQGYEPWDDTYPIFSPDSQRIAFMAKRGGKTMMVIDGTEGKPYRSLCTQPPPDVFSPDSKRSIYVAEIDEKRWVVVLDGIEGKTYDFVDDPQFSPDSQRVVYKVCRDKSSLWVVDGVDGLPFRSVNSVSFSPDSKRVAYSALTRYRQDRHTMMEVVVVDGTPDKEYEGIEWWPWFFSPDSKHVVYIAKIGKKHCMVMDGQEGPLFDWADSMRFSPDGKQMAYTALRGNQTVTICDGKEIAKGAVLFSPDWQHQAHLLTRGLFGGSWTIVRDGKEGLLHNVGEPWRTHLCFSPDSQRLAYWSSENRDVEFVVVDGVQSIRYRRVEIGNDIFSPDSKHVAYWATPASGKWHVFVDGSYTDAYDEPLYNSKLVFDGPDTLHALAVRGGEIFRLEIKILSP